MAFFSFLTFTNFCSQGMCFFPNRWKKVGKKLKGNPKYHVFCSKKTQFTCTVILGNRFSVISNHLARNDYLRVGLIWYHSVRECLPFTQKISLFEKTINILPVFIIDKRRGKPMAYKETHPPRVAFKISTLWNSQRNSTERLEKNHLPWHFSCIQNGKQWHSSISGIISTKSVSPLSHSHIFRLNVIATLLPEKLSTYFKRKCHIK